MEENIDTLVLSAGGMKCISILGSLYYLIKNKIIDDSFKGIKTIYYTSGSSVFTLPLLLGFTIHTTIKIFKDIDYKLIANLQEDLSLDKLLKDLGLSSSKKYKYLLEVFLTKKGIKKDINLKEFYELNKININYCVVNITKDKYEMLNHTNSPDLSLLEAISMACNIPILLKPIKYNGSLYIDAGLVETLNYKELINNPKSIGIDILTTNISNNINHSKCKNNFKNIMEYINYLYSIYGARVCYKDLNNHIKIYIPGFGGDIEKFKDNVDELINLGYKYTENHFKNLRHIDSETVSNED